MRFFNKDEKTAMATVRRCIECGECEQKCREKPLVIEDLTRDWPEKKG